MISSLLQHHRKPTMIKTMSVLAAVAFIAAACATAPTTVRQPLITAPSPVSFDGMDAYARCKRAQVVIARKLGHQCMHPGWVDTPGVRLSMHKFYQRTQDILRTPEQGADTIAWLAVKQPKEIGFWFDRQIVSEYKVPFTTAPQEEEEKLMKEMQRIVGDWDVKK